MKAEMQKSKEKHLTPPNKFGTRHVQVFLLFSGMAIAYGLRACMSVAIVAMVKEDGKKPPTSNPDVPTFDWDSNTTSLVLSSFFWGYILTQIPSGHFARTYSAKNILAFGIMLSSVLGLAIPFIANYDYIPLIICRILMGCAQGCLLPCTQTLLSRWVPPMERVTLASFVMNGPQLGTVITMLISGALAASWLGWPSIFYFFGAMGIIWGVLFYCLASDWPSQHPSICPNEASYINSSLGNLDKADIKPEVPWKPLLTSLPMWAIIIANCGQTWGFYTMLMKLPSYMKSALNFDISKSGYLSALPYLAMWMLGFPISFLSNFAVRKGMPLVAARKICNSIGQCIPAAAMIALCVVTTTDPMILVGILVVTVGANSGVACGIQINSLDLTPRYAGIVMSLSNMTGNIVGIFAPIAVGAIVTQESNEQQWHLVFYITAAAYFVTNGIYLIFGKATVQPWNDYDVDPTVQNKRMSVISIGGEPVVFVSEGIEEKEEDFKTQC